MGTRRSTTAVLLATLGLVAPLAPAAAAVYEIDAAHSLFAVLTHKAGIASGLAHDHLVVASAPAVRLDFDPAAPELTRFSFAVPVEALEVDAPEVRAAWQGRFQELGIHSGELPPVPEADRRKVHASMVGASQLDGAEFPEIRAEVVALQRRAAMAEGAPGAAGASIAGRGAPEWNVQLRLTIRGRTVDRQLPATWSAQAGTLTAEILGEFHFREFGIEPYSALLGAIRNDDLFHLYVSVVAHRAPPGGP